MAKQEDDEDILKFGNPNYLSEEEYADKIHAPDNFGRGPASEDGPQVRDDESPSGLSPKEELADEIPSEDKEEDPDQKKKLDKEIADDSDDVEKEIAESEPKESEDEADEEAQGNVIPAKFSIPAAPGSAPAKDPRLDKYQQFIDQYKALQAQRSKGDLVNGLLAAGDKIGQSMAGKYSGNFTPDQSGMKMLQEMNNRPVQDFEQGQVVQGRGMQLRDSIDDHDATSSKSRMIREYLNKRLGLNLGDDVSAADAMQLLKTVGRPTQTKYQKVNGTTVVDGKAKSMSAIFDPGSGQYIDPETRQVIPGFHAESLNPFQSVVDPNTGQRVKFDKSKGTLDSPNPSLIGSSQNSNDFYAALSKENPNLRKELNDKVIPNFNKLTQKTQERLMHEAPMMARLDEAQLNPAAYAQLQAELARFDVGDQRLAQQEFNMFAVRHGYKGWGDWVQKNTTGTISKSFADDFAKTIYSTTQGLRQELNKQAENHANLIVNRLPSDQKVDPSIVAPLIYGQYKPTAQSPDMEQGEIKRATKDGKIAIFDSKSKKFIRYEDNQYGQQ